MGRYLIHVGIHKTGSTLLQFKIFPHLSKYNLITRQFTQYNEIFNRMQFEDDSLFDLDVFKEQIEEFGENVLLSDEAFSGKPNYAYLNRSMIAYRLQKAFPKARILIVIRGQKDLIHSQYSEYVKRGGSKAIQSLFRVNLGRSLTHDDYVELSKPQKASFVESKGYSLYYDTNDEFIHLNGYKYSYLIKLYKSLFSDVRVLLYEDLRENPNHFITSLEDFLEEPFSDEIKNSFFNEKVNRSLNFNQISLLRQINRMKNGFPKRVLSQIVMNYLKGDNELSFKDFLDIPSYFKQDNNSVDLKYPEIGIRKYSDNYFL